MLRAFLAMVFLVLAAAGVSCAHPLAQGAPAVSEKAGRTPAQQKINSEILYEIYRRQGRAAKLGIPPGPTPLRIDSKGRTLCDVRAEVTPMLQQRITALGAEIVSASPAGRSIIAWIPLLKIERLASHAAVRAIEPKAEPAIRIP
jgi:hypothetical protein